MGIPAVGDVTAAPLNYMINCLMDERLSVLIMFESPHMLTKTE